MFRIAYFSLSFLFYLYGFVCYRVFPPEIQQLYTHKWVTEHKIICLNGQMIHDAPWREWPYMFCCSSNVVLKPGFNENTTGSGFRFLNLPKNLQQTHMKSTRMRLQGFIRVVIDRKPSQVSADISLWRCLCYVWSICESALMFINVSDIMWSEWP